MSSRTVACLLAFLAFLFMSTPVPAAEPVAVGDWPCWLGPNHDGKSPDKGLLKEWPKEGPKLLWKVTGIGHGYSSVAVAGGKVYITGERQGQGESLRFRHGGQAAVESGMRPGRG